MVDNGLEKSISWFIAGEVLALILPETFKIIVWSVMFFMGMKSLIKGYDIVQLNLCKTTNILMIAVSLISMVATFALSINQGQGAQIIYILAIAEIILTIMQMVVFYLFAKGMAIALNKDEKSNWIIKGMTFSVIMQIIPLINTINSLFITGSLLLSNIITFIMVLVIAFLRIMVYLNIYVLKKSM